MHSIQSIATYDFLAQVECIVVHDSHMVRVPTNRTTHVQHQFRHIKQHRRNLVRYTFCRVEVASIKRNNLLILCCITNIEVIRTYGIAFETDTEYLRFDTILHVIIFSCENLVERILQQGTILHTVYGNILATVMHPQVHDTRIALTLTHFFGYGTTTLGMLNPEATDTFVRIRQGQVARLRM